MKVILAFFLLTPMLALLYTTLHISLLSEIPAYPIRNNCQVVYI